MMDWWQRELALLLKKARRLKAAIMIYGARTFGRKKNRRIFEQRQLSPMEVLHKIKVEVITTTKQLRLKTELSFK